MSAVESFLAGLVAVGLIAALAAPDLIAALFG